MGKLKISSNLFLEVAELERFRKFIEDDGYKVFVKYLTKSFGIAQNSDNTLFKVGVKSGSSDTITVNAGVAFDSDLNIIFLKEDKEIQVENTGVKKWVVLSYASTNDEEGTVSISNQGVLSGNGTKFTDVLRGQPNFPTKITFTSSKNTTEYEVVEINSDTEAVLSGSFTAENDLKYQVVGTFTPGFQPDDDEKKIYEYDSCEIEVVESEDEPALTDGQFLLASIDFSSDVMSVVDERSSYMFNSENVYANTTGIAENPFTALRSTTLKSDRILDVQFEWGYKVQRYEMLNTSLNNIFNILSGESKYIPSGTKIPDNVFASWRLVNRKNMTYVTIDSNQDSNLYISKFNSELITNTDDDFVIIPPYQEIEIEAALSGTNYNDDDTNYMFKFSIENLKSRFIIPLEYLDTLVSLRYRMKSGTETTKFQNFAITQFTNVDGNAETLGNSSFEVNIAEPVEKVRNYS
jgi:hypothetical protein